MINRLAAPAALPFGRSAPCRQGRRCSPDHNSHISNQSPASKVCHFQLPEMCHFRLPLTIIAVPTAQAPRTGISETSHGPSATSSPTRRGRRRVR